MPRPYRLGARQASTDETRAKIISGARELLLSDDGYRQFTMDAIAKHTGVARMTVYYQFQSKTGLFEALADDIAERGEIRVNIEASFGCRDAGEALGRMIDAFVHFWLSDVDVMRKLHALSTLDPDSHAADRDAWRKQALETMMARVKKQLGLTAKDARRGGDAVYMLTTFAPCEALSREGRSEREIAKRIRDLVGGALGVDLTN